VSIQSLGEERVNERKEQKKGKTLTNSIGDERPREHWENDQQKNDLKDRWGVDKWVIRCSA